MKFSKEREGKKDEKVVGLFGYIRNGLWGYWLGNGVKPPLPT